MLGFVSANRLKHNWSLFDIVSKLCILAEQIMDNPQEVESPW